MSTSEVWYRFQNRGSVYELPSTAASQSVEFTVQADTTPLDQVSASLLIDDHTVPTRYWSYRTSNPTFTSRCLKGIHTYSRCVKLPIRSRFKDSTSNGYTIAQQPDSSCPDLSTLDSQTDTNMYQSRQILSLLVYMTE